MKRKEDFVRIAEYDGGKGLSMIDSINAANQRNLRILSNPELDYRLVDSDEWKKEREMYPCYSGTFIAYEAPGIAFGKTISFSGLVVNVPKQFRDRKDCALVCNHPDFILKDNVFTLGRSAKCISFPSSDGWYIPESEFGIPNGDKTNSLNKAARYLWRRNSSFSGLVARDDYCYWRDVYAYYYGIYLGRLGVLAVKE
jgi:hypothetical protein